MPENDTTAPTTPRFNLKAELKRFDVYFGPKALVGEDSSGMPKGYGRFLGEDKGVRETLTAHLLFLQVRSLSRLETLLAVQGRDIGDLVELVHEVFQEGADDEIPVDDEAPEEEEPGDNDGDGDGDATETPAPEASSTAEAG